MYLALASIAACCARPFEGSLPNRTIFPDDDDSLRILGAPCCAVAVEIAIAVRAAFKLRAVHAHACAQKNIEIGSLQTCCINASPNREHHQPQHEMTAARGQSARAIPSQRATGERRGGEEDGKKNDKNSKNDKNDKNNSSSRSSKHKSGRGSRKDTSHNSQRKKKKSKEARIGCW